MWLIAPWLFGEPACEIELVPLGDGVFRMGREEWRQSRLTIDTVLDGRATRVVYDFLPFYPRRDALTMPTDPNKARYYRKQVPLFRLIEKMKLWPSRRGILHGVREFEPRGQYAVVVTHCNKRMVVHDSKTSRAARWLRNKWFVEACPQCRIPEWKLQKYAATKFQRGYGSYLREE